MAKYKEPVYIAGRQFDKHFRKWCGNYEAEGKTLQDVENKFAELVKNNGGTCGAGQTIHSWRHHDFPNVGIRNYEALEKIFGVGCLTCFSSLEEVEPYQILERIKSNFEEHMIETQKFSSMDCQIALEIIEAVADFLYCVEDVVFSFNVEEIEIKYDELMRKLKIKAYFISHGKGNWIMQEVEKICYPFTLQETYDRGYLNVIGKETEDGYVNVNINVHALIKAHSDMIAPYYQKLSALKCDIKQLMF